jgi:hypothetical protein
MNNSGHSRSVSPEWRSELGHPGRKVRQYYLPADESHGKLDSLRRTDGCGGEEHRHKRQRCQLFRAVAANDAPLGHC